MDPVRTCSTVGEREEQAARFDFINEPNILMTPEVHPTVAKAETWDPGQESSFDTWKN